VLFAERLGVVAATGRSLAPKDNTPGA
jgi:hypothetical protein